MPVRELGAADRAAYRMLNADAFGGRLDPADIAAPRDFTPGQTVLGIDSTVRPGGEDGVLAAAARIRHDRVALGGGVVPSAGIAGLSVHPAHRGEGRFTQLLRAALARSTADGHGISMLFPTAPEIYRRHGYQLVTRIRSLVVPLADLQRIPPVPDRRLVPVTAGTMPRLRTVYQRAALQGNAMLLREGPLFEAGLPGGGWNAVLLVDEQGIDRGYVSWTRRRGAVDGAALEVHELYGEDRSDRLALLRSLGSWSSVTDQLRLRVRTEDPVLDVLPGASARPAPDAEPLVMLRVLDTAATLRARRAPQGLTGSVRLVVEDDTVPPGTCRAAGSFIVSAADGVISVQPAGADQSAAEPSAAEPSGARPSAGEPSAPPAARLDVHAASLLLAGGRTLADARRLDLGVGADPAAETFLDALLAGPRPSVMDQF